MVPVLVSRQYVFQLRIVFLFQTSDHFTALLNIAHIDSYECVGLWLTNDIANVVLIERVQVQVGQ